MSTVVWFDTSLLIDIESGALQGGLDELARMQRDGFKMLLPKHVETEFLFSKAGAQNMAQRQAFLQRFGLQVDTMASQVPLAQVRAWTDQATAAGLGHGDAKMVAHVRASAHVRNIRNPVLLSQNTKDIAKMRLQGVNALKFEPVALRPNMHIAVHGGGGGTKPKSSVSPATGAPTRGAMFKAGLKGAFSAASIASMIPDVILKFADRAAAKQALRNIQVKFIKEGFARGVAAGIMRWTEAELDANSKNRMTSFRLQGMGDAAGMLKLGDMLKLAEAFENYAVDVGYAYAGTQNPAWKDQLRDRGFAFLRDTRYHFGDDPEALFEFEFIDKLAWAIHHSTDAIIEPAIKFDSWMGERHRAASHRPLTSVLGVRSARSKH
ncbi:hypothetical protein [Bradyrhizobium sp. USDA 329]|uniref:hypothetical protein n=1 Tax=unclassified Bradyrhizobium TaxID=2631580 RepID=UPI003517E07B